MALQTKPMEVEVEVRGIKITGTPLSSSVVAEINTKATKIKGKGDARRTIVDESQQRFQIFSAMIKSWSEAFDTEGVELECTEAVKKDIFEYDPAFVNQVITEINIAVAEKRTVARKN